MRVLFLVLSVLAFAGCTKYRYEVFIHDDETKKNHYVVVKYANDQSYLLDCYSNPDTLNWTPICREVKALMTPKPKRAVFGDIEK